MNRKPVNLFWFRRDLRLHDNRGLSQALQGGQPLLALFLFDQTLLRRLADKKDARVDFIWRALVAIQQQLRPFGTGVLVRIGEPVQVWKELLNEFTIHAVYTNEDYEPEALRRDQQIAALLQSHGIGFHAFKDQVILAANEVVKSNGEPYTVFTPYLKKWRTLVRPALLAPSPSAMTASSWLPIKTSIPALAEIGFKPTGVVFPPADLPEEIVFHYDQTRDFPAQAGTTRLGVHLRFGTVSIRELVRRGITLNETWVNELVWREFFMQIMHHFPHVADGPFRPAYANIRWREDPERLQKWFSGHTGYPLVDAGMRELNATGFMHNRVRMVCASFLAKHLLINWQKGEKYFSDKLLDFDLAANNGNWQWSAGCGCDAAPYFRVFNPERQAVRFDPERKYIKHWVPEVDTSAYAKPVVEHAPARLRALLLYKEALQKQPG